MKQLVFLGNASNSLSELNTCSFALERASSNWVLIDCGPDTPRQIGRWGIPLLDINCIIITHRHLDHCLGVPYFLFGRNLEIAARRRTDPTLSPSKLFVIAETDLWRALIQLFRTCHPDVQLGYDIEQEEIGSYLQEPKTLDGIEIQTFLMNHTVPAYGFVITEMGRKVLAYSTDTLPVETFIEAAKYVKVLIQEAMVPETETSFSNSAKHATTVQAGSVIGKIGPEHAFLMHIRPVYWNKRSDLEAEVFASSGIPARYPEDGHAISLEA